MFFDVLLLMKTGFLWNIEACKKKFKKGIYTSIGEFFFSKNNLCKEWII